MGVVKGRSQRSTSKQPDNSKQPSLESLPQLPRTPKQLLRMAKRKFVFDDLPDNVRMRIYHFLGFPTFSDVVMGTDILQHYNIKLTLRNVYKLDLSSDGSLSVPWNYEANGRSKHFTPKVMVNMMCTNSKIRDELYQLLYNQSLFLIHTPNIRRPAMAQLCERPLSLITHAIVSYNAIEATKSFFKVATHHEALKQEIVMVAKALPNLKYFAVNFWSFQIEPNIGVDWKAGSHHETEARSALAGERPDFEDGAFMTRTLTDLVNTHPTIETFALLRNMQPRGSLSWGKKNKDTVKKAIARNARKCIEKVYKGKQRKNNRTGDAGD